MSQTLCIAWVILCSLVLLCDGLTRLRFRYKSETFANNTIPSIWFTQHLDHFQPTDTRTWSQRYGVVQDYYEKGGPVFLMIGGEGEEAPAYMQSGAWVHYAKKFKALMFQLEHRYYGESHPTSDLSVENLKYLSSEQALADLATFIVGMNNKYELPSDTKWVAFGGSYAGNLAAWVRYKYPHLVHAAVSSSGPVLAKVDFPEYFDVVKDALAFHSSQCVEAIEAANKDVNILLETPEGQKIITEKFRLCDPIDAQNSNDIINFLDLITEKIVYSVQYGLYDRIYYLCNIMINEALGRPANRLAVINKIPQGTCLKYKYDDTIKALKNTYWSANTGRRWIYQTCTEFGYYQTSQNNKALFGKDFPLDFNIQQCTDVFGKEFTKGFIYQAVDRSNTIYGGLDLQATRVVYVHGSLDPWHPLGITKTRIPESPAILINGTAHCANMKDPADTDLPGLTAARQKISSLIGKWIQET